MKTDKKKIVNMLAISLMILVLVLSLSFMGCKAKTAAETTGAEVSAAEETTAEQTCRRRNNGSGNYCGRGP